MHRPLNILAPTRYPWRFNSPRQSVHTISIRNFLPLNKISEKIEGVTVFNPLPLKSFDLIHAFNRIPLGTTPFIIGFESHLPRAFGLEHTPYYRFLVDMLLSPRCRAIIAISEYAKRQFLLQHSGKPWLEALTAKLIMHYPSIDIPKQPDQFTPNANGPIKLLFVGNHFARKGGMVGIRLAQLAQQHHFPLEIDIITALEIGQQSWTDPTREGYFTPWIEQLKTLPNIYYHGKLPNAQVHALIQKAHFMLLSTFSDSFGFSMLESMANSTPVIGTAQAALPECIDNTNGILLPLETTPAGEWKYIGRTDRGTREYEAIFTEEIEKLATTAFTRIQEVMRTPGAYAAMRANTRATAEAMFSATAANAFWDALYEKSVA